LKYQLYNKYNKVEEFNDMKLVKEIMNNTINCMHRHKILFDN